MPFESEQQRKFMFANIPEIARKWARHTARKNRLKRGKHRKEEPKSKTE